VQSDAFRPRLAAYHGAPGRDVRRLMAIGWNSTQARFTDCRVFENRKIGIPPTLFFDIEIPLEPFQYNGETEETIVRLDFIEFDVATGEHFPVRALRSNQSNARLH